MVSLLALFIGYIGTSKIKTINEADFEMYDTKHKTSRVHGGRSEHNFKKCADLSKMFLSVNSLL